MPNPTPLVEMQDMYKYFGNVLALHSVSLHVHAGEVMCLLGDNGAGKSTLIKLLSGVYQPTQGRVLINGHDAHFSSPADALDAGIATVYQDLAMVPLMSVTRNFFMGREPTKGFGFLRRVDWRQADRITLEEMEKIGIEVRDPSQPVGTLSGGERQCVAIARAIYFGARILILDEPTSALGVRQASVVLRYIAQAKARNLGVIFITHNVHHAYPVGDAFTILKRGRSLGTFRKADISRDALLGMMAGGEELDNLEEELQAFEPTDPTL
jgi:simple sugar transport system ATP-binding protein